MSPEAIFAAAITASDEREAAQEAADRRKDREYASLRDEMAAALRTGVSVKSVRAPMTSPNWVLPLHVAFGEAIVSPAIESYAQHLLIRLIGHALSQPHGECKALAEQLCELVSIQHAEDNT